MFIGACAENNLYAPVAGIAKYSFECSYRLRLSYTFVFSFVTLYLLMCKYWFLKLTVKISPPGLIALATRKQDWQILPHNPLSHQQLYKLKKSYFYSTLWKYIIAWWCQLQGTGKGSTNTKQVFCFFKLLSHSAFMFWFIKSYFRAIFAVRLTIKSIDNAHDGDGE